MPGHLLSMFVKEKFDEMLQAVRLGMVTEMRKDYARFMGRIPDQGESRLFQRALIFKGTIVTCFGRKIIV